MGAEITLRAMAAREDIVSNFDALRNALTAVHQLILSGDSAVAMTRLQELEQAHPASGLLWQERAFCLRSSGDEDAAEAAFRRAVEFNDALPEAWRYLMETARAAGRSTEADRAARALAKLSSLPPELIEGSSRLSEGDLTGADTYIRGFLNRHGPHLEGMRLLAQVCMHRKNYEDAELLLEAVLDRNPEYHEARYELGMVFLQRRRIYPALLQARRLLPLDPSDRKTQMLYATACDGLGEFDEALRVYRELQKVRPGDPEVEFAVAGVLRNQGKAQDAIVGYRRAIRLEGCAGTGYAALANMKTYRFNDEEIAEMRRLERAEESPARRFPVCFALGKALEDRGEYQESFEQYARGNALRRAESRYNPETTERNIAMRAGLFTPEFLAGRRGMGCLRPDPIFIVGMPRAGSTLLEQVLASHSQVDGTLELPEIPRLVRQFRGRSSEDVGRYATVLAELTPQELKRLGEIYLEETQVYRERAPFFVDKLPANFMDVGFIHLILPNARIIDARRDALACCFSNFKQLFANGQEFSYDLAHLGKYYRGYVRLMDHWDRVLPGKVLHVRHADTVNDFEGTVRRILGHCGLPFEEPCLEFYKTERSVRTMSSEQVRRPINREGLELWRHYEPWLGPLKEALGPLAEADLTPGADPGNAR